MTTRTEAPASNLLAMIQARALDPATEQAIGACFLAECDAEVDDAWAQMRKRIRQIQAGQ